MPEELGVYFFKIGWDAEKKLFVASCDLLKDGRQKVRGQSQTAIGALEQARLALDLALKSKASEWASQFKPARQRGRSLFFSKDEIKNLYDAGESLKTIGKMFGADERRVKKMFDRWKFPLRSASEASSLANVRKVKWHPGKMLGDRSIHYLKRAYADGHSLNALAQLCDVTPERVRRFLKSWDVQMRTPEQARICQSEDRPPLPKRRLTDLPDTLHGVDYEILRHEYEQGISASMLSKKYKIPVNGIINFLRAHGVHMRSLHESLRAHFYGLPEQERARRLAYMREKRNVKQDSAEPAKASSQCPSLAGHPPCP